jgi:hypothetical protein
MIRVVANTRWHWIVGALVALVGAWACAPAWGGVWWQGHEYNHYPVRLAEYVRLLRAGYMFPRWAPDFYGGFGSPFFNYYSPGVFAAAAPAVLLGAAPTTALKLVLAASTALGAFGSFGLVRGETGRADAGAVAALAFIYVPYRMFDVWCRGDLAEVCAASIVPASLWMMRALWRVDRARLAAVGCALAAGVAATVMTHTLIGQWSTELLVLLMIAPAIRAWRRGERARVATAATALVGACGLSAIYALPAALEQDLVHIENMLTPWFAPARHVVPLSLEPRDMFFPGEPVIAAVALLPVAALLPRRRRVLAALPWLGAAAVLFALLLEPSRPLWAGEWLPLSRFIQFPWRLLALVAVTGAAAVGTMFAALVPERPRWLGPPLALAACAWIGLRSTGAQLDSVDHYRSPWFSASQIPSLDHIKGGTVTKNEHLPAGVRWEPPQPRNGLLQTWGRVKVLEAKQPVVKIILQLDAPTAAWVDVQHFWFPGWRVRALDGSPEATLEPAPGGMMRVKLPRAGYYKLALEFGLTPLRLFATLATWLTLLGLYPLLRLISRPRTSS